MKAMKRSLKNTAGLRGIYRGISQHPSSLRGNNPLGMVALWGTIPRLVMYRHGHRRCGRDETL